MNIIIDTHIFLYALVSPEKIESHKRNRLESRTNTIYVSSVSVAEIMIKTSLGKLDFPFDPVEMIERSGFEELDFSSPAACLLRTLPFHHRDPFDRMLISQALYHDYMLMSDDEKIAAYDCTVI
ncbi:MAG: type II toxin-antitoxin system VapC family toxin [Spirochaetia bacterium]